MDTIFLQFAPSKCSKKRGVIFIRTFFPFSLPFKASTALLQKTLTKRQGNASKTGLVGVRSIQFRCSKRPLITFLLFYNICLPPDDSPIMKGVIKLQSYTVLFLFSRLSFAIVNPRFQPDIVIFLDLDHE